MTSSKFPLYLTNEEWKLVTNAILNPDQYDTVDEWKATYAALQKLKDQLEKLGVKA